MTVLARASEWTRPSAAPAREAQAGAHHYFAFLSYSHADSADADWLHRELERFRVPSSLVGRLTANGVVPKNLTPVFRDRHELAASHDLGAEIRHALECSRSLIILCSPAAAKSHWVNAEIDQFKRLHPEGCIIAGVVGGEPLASDIPGREDEECFPPALVARYNRRGKPTGQKTEPLAADLREGKGGRRTGFLKIVAGILGVGLDELVQREQLRRQRRMAYIAAASLAGMAVTSTLALAAIQSRDEAREQRSQAEGLVGFMLGDLREKLEPLGRLDTLDAVGGQALAYYEKQDKADLSDDALAQRSKALTLMGEIAQTRGDLDSALRLYREAFATTAEAVRRYPDEAQRLFDHAQNVFWVGYIAYQRGRLDEAGTRFQEYQRLADQMVALEPENNVYRRETVYANTNLGTVLMDELRYREAAGVYEASVRGAEAVAAAEPEQIDYQRSVTNNLGWLADAYEFSGELDRALAARERQIRLLLERERKDPRDASTQRELMTGYRSVGRLVTAQGDASAGLAPSVKGVAIAESLLRIEPGNTEWLQASANNYFDLADVFFAADRLADAKAATRAGCEQVDRLLQRDSSVVNWKSAKRVNCLARRSRAEVRDGAADSGLRLAREALAAANLATKPNERAMLQLHALSAASDALQAAGRHEQSVAVAGMALAAAARAPALTPAEMAKVAVLQVRTGRQAQAQRTLSTLTAIGYRHPTFTRRIRTERAGR